MWEEILGNSGRAVGKWDKEGKEAAKGCVINQASYHRGHLGLDPTKELQDRAKSVSGVISDRGAREIGYLTHHLPAVIGRGLLLGPSLCHTSAQQERPEEKL